MQPTSVSSSQFTPAVLNFTDIVFGDKELKSAAIYDFRVVAGIDVEGFGELEIARTSNSYFRREESECEIFGDLILHNIAVVSTSPRMLIQWKEAIRAQNDALQELHATILSVWNEFCYNGEKDNLDTLFSEQDEAVRVAFQYSVLSRREIFKK